MREIKFRAWQKFHKKMLKVDSLKFGNDGEIKSICVENNKNTIPRFNTYYNEHEGFPLIIDGEPVIILMQYTGLKDKNGVEIYEGDIVSVTDQDGEYTCCDCGVGKVEYLKEFGFYNVSNIENSIHELNFQDYVVEVIGNIYENPELVGVER